uniref:Uncharacterized protein n=1 Tax=Anopheles farauti TaxID=69004 RepID=A0A182Q1J1_9DIPT
MSASCNVGGRQRFAASVPGGADECAGGGHRGRTRVARHGWPRLSYGCAACFLLVTLLGPAFDGGPNWRPTHFVGGSEFPERECCDPVYPPMPDPEPVPGPAYPTTTISSSSSFQTGLGGGVGVGGGGGLIGGGGVGSTAVGNELGGGGLTGMGTGSGQLSSSRPMHIGYSVLSS